MKNKRRRERRCRLRGDKIRWPKTAANDAMFLNPTSAIRESLEKVPPLQKALMVDRAFMWVMLFILGLRSYISVLQTSAPAPRSAISKYLTGLLCRRYYQRTACQRRMCVNVWLCADVCVCVFVCVCVCVCVDAWVCGCVLVFGEKGEFRGGVAGGSVLSMLA